MRNLVFVEGEYYHVYNRGVDKKPIFLSKEDMDRFFNGIIYFNDLNSIGSLGRFARTRRHSVSTSSERKRLVKIIAYCLNPNHFHLIIEQVVEKGIEKFMHKLTMGHSKYMNAKYHRSGALLQGSFKANHIDTNEYLLHVSAYVNLNNKIHRYDSNAQTRSSWEEYMGIAEKVCDKEIVMEQFQTNEAYKKYALDALENIMARKEDLRELENDEIELVITR